MNKSLSHHLFNEDGNDLLELFKGKLWLYKVMDKFMCLCSPNICNLVTSFKHLPANRSYIDDIFLLKSNSHYDYIKDSCFLGQMSSQKVFFLLDVHR